MSGVANLTCEQGATFSRTVTWKNDGTAVNLTAYSARMQVREDYSAATALVSLTSTPAAGLVLGGALGTIAITITATATALLARGKYVYDLELVDGSGTVTRLIEGTFTVTPEATK